jgi:hypothetical protein
MKNLDQVHGLHHKNVGDEKRQLTDKFYDELDTFDNFSPSISTNELNAIMQYTGPDYTHISRILNNIESDADMKDPVTLEKIIHNSTLSDPAAVGASATDIPTFSEIESLTKSIKNIDSAIKKNPLPKDTTLYTSLRPNRWGLKDFEAGKTFSFKSFRSTTIDPTTITSFAYSNSEVQSKRKDTQSTAKNMRIVLEIDGKKGDPAMPIAQASSIPSEQEILLARNTKLRIISGPHKLVWEDPDVTPAKMNIPASRDETYYFKCEIVKT